MKKTVFVAALLATSSLGTVTAFAFGNGGNVCAPNLCDTNVADFRQTLDGFQDAINSIVDIDEAVGVVQKAVNAGNLITVVMEDDDGNVTADLNLGLGSVVQDADLYQFASNTLDAGSFDDFSDITQSATNVANSVTGQTMRNVSQVAGNSQEALNSATSGFGSSLYALEQAATNVANTITGTSVKVIDQKSWTDQTAENFVLAASYDADQVDWEPTDPDVDVTFTQAAVNASNLVEIDRLELGGIDQAAWNSQSALNEAIFVGHDADVYDFGQSATNVANNVTVGEIWSAGCGCYGLYEIDQVANVGQIAENLLETTGAVNNVIQSATNIANSISIPSVD